MNLPPFLVVGLGNPVIRDDAAGLVAVEEARKILATSGIDLRDRLDLTLDTSGGIDLLYIVENREKVLFVDAVSSGKAKPGSVFEIPFAELRDAPGGESFTTHYASLPELISLGQRLGMVMPREVRIIAIAAEDLETITESLTPRVKAAIPLAALMILDIVREWLGSNSDY